MCIQSNIRDEKPIALRLTELYGSRGYKKFKMSKFEEYDLYAENRNFLKSDNILTFTDMSGRLLALKPDITLSIVKNATDAAEHAYKLYYDESVYRVLPDSKDYTEITQVGLELLGNIDLYSSYEVLSLAVRSLTEITPDYVLDISHIGFVSGLLDSAGISSQTKRRRVLELIGERNQHELRAFCTDLSIPSDILDKILTLPRLYGSFEEIMPKIQLLSVNAATDEAIAELKANYAILKQCGLSEKLMLDFSIVNDAGYYNGIIFRGYIRNIPRAVLSGGRYDKLLEKFDINAGAIGFAVYMNVLDEYLDCNKEYDTDVLLIYDNKSDAAVLAEKVEELCASGKSVRLQNGDSGDIRAKEIINIANGRCGCNE